jgi:hypothetical protein
MYKLIRDAALPKDCVQPTIVTGEIPREQLFDDQYDVYIAPEKYNGLSLPLQEAFASGMMVMTTNRFPANTWLPTAPLIPPTMTRITQVMGGHLKFEESVIDPEAIAMCLDGWYGRNIEEFSFAGLQYAEANSWTVLKPLYIAALESVL